MMEERHGREKGRDGMMEKRYGRERGRRGRNRLKLKDRREGEESCRKGG